MASRRTISYIGLWALIMPWLGFSWGTKTILFSLTGIMLLFIGNRHYNSEKKKKANSQDINNSVNTAAEITSVKPEPINKMETVSTYKPVPDYMATNSSMNTESHVNHVERTPEFTFEKKEEPITFHTTAKSTVETGDSIDLEKPKPRQRTKVEMAARPKRTSPKPITLDSLNSDYGEEQI